MQVRDVVDILTTYFPDASADQIESTVGDLANALGIQGASSNGSGVDRAIVTVYGHDRPGILATVTAIVSRGGNNILDVSQKILQGYFTLIMLIEIGDSSVGALQEELSKLAESAGVRAVVQHEELFNAMHRP
jgi:ACT domain-containing protein